MWHPAPAPCHQSGVPSWYPLARCGRRRCGARRGVGCAHSRQLAQLQCHAMLPRVWVVLAGEPVRRLCCRLVLSGRDVLRSRPCNVLTRTSPRHSCAALSRLRLLGGEVFFGGHKGGTLDRAAVDSRQKDEWPRRGSFAVPWLLGGACLRPTLERRAACEGPCAD